jgi:hypothetical protein
LSNIKPFLVALAVFCPHSAVAYFLLFVLLLVFIGVAIALLQKLQTVHIYRRSNCVIFVAT